MSATTGQEATTEGESGTSDPGSKPDITEDEIFEILGNQRRRFVLHFLMDEEQADLGTVAEQVAAWENGTVVEEVSSTDRKYVYTALQQTHLPKMDDAGVIEYDRNRGTIETTDAIREFDIYMEIVADRDVPWAEYYLGLGMVGAGVLGAVWTNVFPFGLFPDIAWGAFLVAALIFSATAHLYYSRQMRLGAIENPPEISHGP